MDTDNSRPNPPAREMPEKEGRWDFFTTTGGNGQLPSCGVSGDGKASNPEMPTITVKKIPNKSCLSKEPGKGLPIKAGNF